MASGATAGIFAAARTIVNFNRAYWQMLLRLYGWGRTA